MAARRKYSQEVIAAVREEYKVAKGNNNIAPQGFWKPLAAKYSMNVLYAKLVVYEAEDRRPTAEG